MNLEQLQFLVDNLQEGLNVEVKNWLGGLVDNADKAKLAKEIIALGNNDGGYIFIGFDDTVAGHPEITPGPGELDAYAQDNIASLVNRYVEPACQCRLAYVKKTGSQITHPVIIVPGSHRTPLWAKAASPDQQTLRHATVYVRRPGGSSEPARTQDDWERLIDRLVKARQDDLLVAVRTVLNPSETLDLTAKPKLEAWEKESYQAWSEKVAQLPARSPHRLENGHWSFSFVIEPFDCPDLVDLNRFLEQEAPKYSGWPPFTYLHAPPRKPVALGNLIEAWLYNPASSDPDFSDYWRVSMEGAGFLLRPMQEDRPGFMSNRMPGPELPAFDWLLPIYRVTELLKFVEAIGTKFADANAQVSTSLRYYRSNDRRLCCHDFNYLLDEGARCAVPEISSRVAFPIAELSINLEERVSALLSPIFAQFEFTELPKAVVDTQVSAALGRRGR